MSSDIRTSLHDLMFAVRYIFVGAALVLVSRFLGRLQKSFDKLQEQSTKYYR